MFTNIYSGPMEDTFIIPSEISLGKDDKIMVLDNETFAPLCEAFVVE